MRICNNCKKRMQEGFVINSGCEYYCSDDCLHTKYTQEEYMELYDEGEGDSYWTDWHGEDEEDDEDDFNYDTTDTSDTWEFVEKHYPNYCSDDDIALIDDLFKILNGECESGDDASRLFYEKYQSNYALVFDDYRALLLNIYIKSIRNFSKNNK